MSKMDCPEIESDTDWQLTPQANPMRGYHDYQRRVTFRPDTPQKIQQDTIDAIMAPYKYTGGPTWSSHEQVGVTWFLKQGYDSGD